MEAKRLGYSTKNIPLSNKDVYLKELIGNTEHFLHRNNHNINDDMNNTIMNSRKAFLQHFDVTEGSFDGAEICELVGLYLLNQLKDIITNRSVGVYRITVLSSRTNMDRSRQNIIAFFKQPGFQITIEINLKLTDFLDIYLDLENDKFYLYRKPNDTPFYVHRESNHPLNILKQLSKMTSKRLSNLSCNEDEFIKASDEYQNVLKNSGFKDKLVYTPSNQRN